MHSFFFSRPRIEASNPWPSFIPHFQIGRGLQNQQA